MAGGQHRNENQNFGTIFQSGVSKIQHNHGPTLAWSATILDRVINGSVQLGKHVSFQITASGFHQVRVRYACSHSASISACDELLDGFIAFSMGASVAAPLGLCRSLRPLVSKILMPIG